MTPTGNWRYSILRIYWDDQSSRRSSARSAISSPAAGASTRQVSSLAVCVNPGSAFNCYWEMPFRKRRRITLTNIADEPMTLYYQINYTLTDVPDDAAYFHAQFRRTNPLPYKERLHDPRRRARAGALRRHVHGLGREQHRLVGRGRDQVLHGRRRASSRRSAAPAPRTTSAARTTSMSARTTAAISEFTTPYAGLPQVIRPDGVYQLAARASACTAGTSWIRSASSRICG